MSCQYPKTAFLFIVGAVILSQSLSAALIVRDGDSSFIKCSPDASAAGTGKCSSELSPRCQAVANVKLQLNCSSCPSSDKVLWSFKSSINKTNDTSAINDYLKNEVSSVVLIPSTFVTGAQDRGCFICSCQAQGMASSDHSGVFSVAVQEGKPPQLAVGSTPDGTNQYQLTPSLVQVPFSSSDNGSYCVIFKSTGYPNVTYNVTYSITSDFELQYAIHNVSDDVCLRYNSTADHSVLCFTPTLDNVNQTRTYTATITNHEGSIRASQKFEYPAGGVDYSWFLKVHPDQSQGVVRGSEASCAVYDGEEVQYMVCSLPGSGEHLPLPLAQLPCLYAQGGLQCCVCGDSSCSLNITTRRSSASTQAVPTTTCRVNTSTLVGGGRYACLAVRTYRNGHPDSAPQVLGNFSFQPDQPPPSSNQSYFTVPVWGAGTVLALLGLLAVLLLVITVAAVARRAVRRARGPQPTASRGNARSIEGQAGERQPLLQGQPTNPLAASRPSSFSPSITTHPVIEEQGCRSELCVQPMPRSSRLVVRESHTQKELTESRVSTDSLPEESTYILEPGRSYTVEMGRKTVKIIAPDSSSLTNVADFLPGGFYDSDTPSAEQPRSSSRTPLWQDSYKPLPPNIDQFVPLSMNELLPYLEKLAPKWSEIGNGLRMEDTVRVLRVDPSAPTLTGKLSVLFECWLDSAEDVTWPTLVRVLRTVGCQRAAIAMCNYLNSQVLELPPNIDELVPVKMCVLLKIVTKVCPYWDKIGDFLKLHGTLPALKASKSSSLVKMTILFETWAERKDGGTTWAVLLGVLEDDLQLHGEGAKLRQYILEELKRQQSKLLSSSTS